MSTSLFKDRKLIIATKHKKESVIAPILEKNLGLVCFIDPDFDTDALGTFTGEIERELDPIESARKKCLLAMEKNQCDLGVASEGSFGAHPSVPFAQADDEFLIFIDKRNDLEILVRELSLDTNFGAKTVASEHELLEFATQVKFPSHGLILRQSKTETEGILKGITNERHLVDGYNSLLKKQASVYVETDMRALFNPSRMAVIERLTKALVDKILSECPNCDAPGFGITDVIPGLPCEWCGSKTKSTLAFLYTCQKCQHTKEAKFPHEKTKEDPMYCDFCNP